MKRYLFFFSILINSLLCAQNFKQCGASIMRNRALKANPKLIDTRAQYLNSLENIKQAKYNSDAVRVIPVVIHVLHTGGSNNITDAQINDAMEIINRDFNKLNPDTANVIDEFQNSIANVGIEFKLAQKDPNGNCTKGITRSYSELTNNAGENVKDFIKWDPSKYLNVWVVSNIEIGAGGYSYYPGEAPNNDANAGIVILASQFGSIGESNGNNSSNRTLTHEIGHYLSLNHTWGNSNENNIQDNCYDDDGISDTPLTIGTNSSCNLSQQSCGSLDNVQNYMDYASCPKMFTKGQGAAMRAALEYGESWQNAPRNNLWTEQNLIETGLANNSDANDCLAIVEIESQSSTVCIGQEVEWVNKSYNYDSEASFEWNFPGGTPNSSNEENPIIFYNQTGLFDVTLTVTTSGGSQTSTIFDAIYVSNSEDKIIAPTEFGFESNQFPINTNNPNANWYVDQSQEDNWSWNLASSTPGNGSLRIRSTDFDDSNFRRLYSPIFDLSNVQAPCYMYYDYAYAIRTNSTNDIFRLKISDDCGLNWTPRITKSSESLATIDENQLFTYTPADDEWETQKINISSWAGEEQLQFLIELSGERGNYLYIDNIRFAVPSLGIEELMGKTLNLEVFPNPTNGNASIKFDLLNPQTLNFELVDLLGTQIHHLEKLYQSGSHELNLSELKENISPGMYFIKCSIGNYNETLRILVH